MMMKWSRMSITGLSSVELTTNVNKTLTGVINVNANLIGNMNCVNSKLSDALGMIFLLILHEIGDGHVRICNKKYSQRRHQ